MSSIIETVIYCPSYLKYKDDCAHCLPSLEVNREDGVSFNNEVEVEVETCRQPRPMLVQFPAQQEGDCHTL